MKPIALLFVLAAAAGRPGRAQEPEPRVVARRFTTELELATERFDFSGTEGDVSEAKHPPPQVREEAVEIELTDTLLDDEDPPQSFTRLYATVASSFELGDQRSPRSKTVNAGLEGKTVTFERERDGGYARTCDDPEVRPVQLKRLRAELDLAPFLPPAADEAETSDAEHEKAEPPASWEVPNEVLPRLFSPLESEVRLPKARTPKDGAKKGPKGGLDLSPAALSMPLGSLLLGLEGTMTATRLTDDEADDAHADLPCHARLEFRLTTTFDGKEALRSGLDTDADDQLELTYAGTGTLDWDPESGRIEVACKGDLRLDETFRIAVEGNGKTAEVKGELVLSGPLAFEGSEKRGE